MYSRSYCITQNNVDDSVTLKIFKRKIDYIENFPPIFVLVCDMMSLSVMFPRIQWYGANMLHSKLKGDNENLFNAARFSKCVRPFWDIMH